MQRLQVMHLLLVLFVLSAAAIPTAPVLPSAYTISFTAISVGQYYSPSMLYYDWTAGRQVSFHTNCIAGPANVSSLPCAIQMAQNATILISPLVSGGCCRFPDGNVNMPAPNAYTFWSYKGNMSVNGQEGYAFTAEGFLWVIRQSDNEPLLFQFASGGQFYFDSEIQPGAPPSSHFILPNANCFSQQCPFCWFPGGGMCTNPPARH